MSPTQPEGAHAEGLVPLAVKTVDSQTEIVILDARGRFVERALGPEHTFALERGIYRVKVLTGAESEEKTVVLTEEPKEPLQFGRVAFASPVPLAGTTTSHEYHVAAADAESRHTHVRAGANSSIFFLVRDWTPWSTPQRRDRIVSKPATGLSLHRISGGTDTKIADLAEAGTSNLDFDAWSACTVEVDPGVYELRLALPAGGSLHQSVVASPGWQTQAFIFMRGYKASEGGSASAPKEWRADLTRTSLLVARGSGFNPDEKLLRLTEIARVALASRRAAVSSDSTRQLLPDELRQMLSQKSVDPMLGIYGGHLMLLESPFDPVLFAKVVRNLRGLLGVEHPDVEALALRADGEPPPAPFSCPPMLRRSWSLMVEASADRADLITESLIDATTTDLWSDGPWHIWERRSAQHADTSETQGLSGVEQALAETLGVMKQVRRAYHENQAAGDAPADVPARRTRGGRSRSRSLESTPTPKTVQSPPLTVELDEASVRSIARQFNLPPSQLQVVLNTLEGKLKGIPFAPSVNVVVSRTDPRSPKAQGVADRSRWCVAWFPLARDGAAVTRAALQKQAKWGAGQTITVRFLGGEPALVERVRHFASEWVAPGMANLRFDFGQSPHADIRVGFSQSNGSWSTVGTTCRQAPPDEPTMNFGWLTPMSSDEEVRSVVLHEFGHALGLVHEHQNPVSGIKWNREAAIRELSGPPQNWSREEIEFNVFDSTETPESNFTQVDPTSIMLSPIPATWTQDGFSTGFNSELSAMDRKLIRQQYP